MFFVPSVTATKTASLATDVNGNGFVNPGDTLMYSVVVSNSGTDAMNVVFTDQLNANLTQSGSATASPIATNDAYNVLGNVSISVPAGSGLLANDVNPQGTGTISASAGVTSSQGGNVTVAPDGSFTYNPPAGFEGTDTFTYTLTHSNTKTDTGTVTLTISGMIWFVNNNAASCTTRASGCGRLSSPYSSLASFQAENDGVGNNPAANDNIFIYESATTYSSTVTLLTGQKLIGQDATATLASIAGVSVPPNSAALPAMNTGAPATTIGNTVTLNTNTTARGFSISSATNTGMNDPAGAITGVSVSEVRVTSTTGTAVLFSSLGGTVSFISVSANGAANGISLTSTTGSFTVSGDGTNNASGGTIQNITSDGVLLTTAQNVSLTSMSIQNTAHYGVTGQAVTNFSFVNGTINNSGTALSAQDSNIGFNGNSGVFPHTPTSGVTYISGTLTVTGSTLTNSFYHGITVRQDTGTISNVNISNNTFTSSTVGANSNGSAIDIDPTGSASAAANVIAGTIDSNVITNFPSGAGIQLLGGNANSAGAPFGVIGCSDTAVAQCPAISVVTVSNNDIQGDPGTKLGTNGIAVQVVGRGKMNIEVLNNGTAADRMKLFLGNAVLFGCSGLSKCVGKINNNFIDAGSNIVASPAISVGTDATFATSDTPNLSLEIVGNNVSPGSDGNGILATARAASASASYGIRNNNIAAPRSGVRPGIRVDAGNASSVDDAVCLDISGNTSAGSGGSQGIGLRKQGTVTTTNDFGVEGMAATATPGVETFINGQNPAGNGTLLISATSGFSSCASAPFRGPIEPEQNLQQSNTSQQNNGGSASTTLMARLRQWLAPVFSAFSSSISYVNLDKAFGKVEPTVMAAESEAIAEERTTYTGPAIPARTMIVNSRGETRIVPTASFAAMAGELITINGTGSGFTLPAGESTTIMFNATIAAGFTGTAITNQASVSGSNFSTTTSSNLSTPVIQAPNFSKAFSPATIATNTGVSALTFQLVNPNPSQALTAVAFTDSLPAGVEVATPVTISNAGCGSPTFAPTAGATSLSFSGGSIGAGGTCGVTVNVRSTTEGAKPNTSSTATSTQANPSGTAAATLTVINAPTFTKAFGASSVPLNGTTSLTFTVTNNSATSGLNGMSFTDSLPAGLIVDTPSGLSTTCNGSVVASPGGGSVTWSGGSLVATASCTISLNVKGTTAGAKPNSATLTTTELGANSATTGTVTLTVFGPPTISKAFSPTSIFVGGTFSQLTFTIANPNASGTLTGVGFSDALPSGLQVDASPGVVISNCGGSTNTSSFTSGATTLNVSNAAVTAGTNCTIRVNVIGTTAGAKPNTTGAITSTEGGTGTVSNTATLNVFTAPQIAKSFGASVIPVGGTTTVTFTITNPAANPGALSTITFIDSLPPGLVVVNPPVPTNTCSGSVTAVNGSGTISLGGASIATPGNTCQVQATVMATTAGVKNNNVTVSSGNGGTGNTSNASLTVANPPTLSKAFSPSLITPNGTSTLTVTLTNPNATVDLTNATLTDTLPAGVTTVNSTAATTCGGTASQTSGSVSLSGGTIPQGGSCTLSVNVTSATNNTYTNTIAAGALTTDAGSNASPASATLLVAAPPTISKAFSPSQITSGGTSTLTVTLSNPNSNVPLTVSGTFTDTLPPTITTITNTKATTCAGGTATQATGSVSLTGGTIPAGGSCTLSVSVTSSNSGSNINTIAAGALVTNGGSNVNPATATLVVGATPAVTVSFSPTTTKIGATSLKTISIVNNNATDFTGVNFTDTLPTGLTTPDFTGPLCGGTITIASNVITLTGGTIGAGQTCATAVTVTGATSGVKNNSVTVNTSNFGSGTGSATLTVYAPPTITKSFLSSSIPFGNNTLMTFVLTNPNTFVGGDLTGLSFNDTLPAGFTTGTNTISICGGTLIETPSTLSFSGGTLGTSGPGNTCTINLTATGVAVGTWPNTTGPLSSTQTGAGATSNTATLTVTASATTTTITNAASLSSTPTVVGQSYAVNVTVAPSGGGAGTPTGTVNVSDGTGATCAITLSGGSGTCNLTSTSAGAKTITANYLGDANFNTSSTTASHTVNKANTTLSNLTDAPDPSVVGQPYTCGFTLGVTSPGAGTPTGTVSVNDGAGGTCTATLPATSCQLTSIVAGNKTLTFTYNGDANFNTSTNTAGHAVNKADTTVAITNDTPDPSVIGQNYAVTAAVSVTSPGSGTPTGTISVTDGTNTCTITLPATSCNLPSTSVGAKTLTATYSGDSNFNGSGPSAGVPHTVNKADTVTTITSDNPDSSAVGQNVTVAFTVAAAAPGAGTPTGNVTITISGGSETCTGALAAGSGSCTLALTVPGARTLTATYNGDTNFNGGTDTEPHTVVAPPSISKAFSPASVPVGQTSTLTFTITNPVANTIALTGVGFTDTFPNAPNLIVANPTGATLTGCGGATLTDNLGGALAPGDLGVMLSGATVGVGGTCTVTVNVTPQAQGTYTNISGAVSSTNGGTGNTATATLSTNTPPTISSNNLSVKAGSSAASFTIATATDPDQAVNTLGITINGNPTSASSNGVTVSSVAIQANGSVTANIATTCAATTATFNLVVTDNQNATGTGTLTVTVTANTPPVLTYNAQTVVAATTPTITPATGPSDNGTFTIGSVSVSPNNGGLGVSLNQSNGVVTILNALLIGNYTVTVPITDNCGATNNAQIAVTVTCPTITLNPANLPNGIVNTAYPQTISASPAGGNYTFSASNGTLPSGLTLNSNGSFSGAPTQSGTFNFRVTATGFGGCTAFNDYTLKVFAPPSVTKAFSPTTVAINGISTLTLTITNPAGNAGGLTGIGIVDNFPPGLQVDTTTAATNTCTGTFAPAPGATSITLTGGAIASVGGSCSISVKVKGTTSGPKANTTNAVTSTEGGSGNTASATLLVASPPTITKAFGAANILLNGTTSLTFTINNPNSIALSGVTFSDSLVAGLVVGTPNGLSNTCNGTVTATAGSSSIGLSNGTLAASGSCTVTVNVKGTTVGTKNNVTSVISATETGPGTTSNTTSVTVNQVTGSLSDPLTCTGPGNTVSATLNITNNGNVSQTIADTTTFTNLVGIPGSCTVTPNVGTCSVTNGNLTYNATLSSGQTVTISYLTQVSDLAQPGQQVCTNNAVSFSGGAPLPLTVCGTVNCPAAGPGGLIPANAETSDQKAGSVLIYNLYTSGVTSANTQNTRINITNTHTVLPAYVHLFFVAEGCSIADSYICLTGSQTASFLASDMDPGTTGYLVAVATDAQGCPRNFNYLIGDEYVKLTSGHAANLSAQAFTAIPGNRPACDQNSVTATLNFDGISYNRTPAVLALDNVGSRADGNDTLLVVNRIGGNLGIGASTLGTLFGVLYDDTENSLSFSVSGNCQLRNSISNNFPRTTPRFESFIPAGRTGWLKLFNQTGAIGITGAAINNNPNANSSAGAFNQGHNLHVLTLTNTASYVIPVFPPSC